jgi:hypothetical protein
MADETPIRYSFLEFDSETVKRCLKVIRNLEFILGTEHTPGSPLIPVVQMPRIILGTSLHSMLDPSDFLRAIPQVVSVTHSERMPRRLSKNHPPLACPSAPNSAQ